MATVTNFSEIPSFSFVTRLSDMNEACSGFDYNSMDDGVTGNTEVRVEYDSEESRLEAVVIEDNLRYGHVFDPIIFGENNIEYDIEFLNELYDLSRGVINPRY